MLREGNPKYRRVPNYTKEQLDQKHRVKKILNNIRHLQYVYEEICASCNHVIPKPPVLLPVGVIALPAICDICNTNVGRMCYYSPDNICHFDVIQIDGKPSIELLDGTIYQPKSRFPRIHHSNWCLFCKEFEGVY